MVEGTVDVTEPPTPEEAAAERDSFEVTDDSRPSEAVEAEESNTSEPGSSETGENTRPARTGEFTEEDLELLWEVWGILEEEFDGELPDDETLTYAAIRGILNALDDDFTRFAPPDVAERMREDLEGSFEGIGAFVRENEQGMTEIVRPMDGQPAAQAGLRAGDIVVAVDGESMVGRGLDEVIALIRGPQGTEVTLEVRREGNDEPLEFTITRQRIVIPIIESEMLDDDIAYVRLTSFNRNANSQLNEALQELLDQNPRGLILDLRDNPGGYLDQSVAVADIFLEEGVILYDRSSTMGTDEVYHSGAGDLAEEIPLAVLVNVGSASASEIVAGAIQDHGRGVVIGETTFGKGSVQQSHVLSDGSELRVTIARWYTPDNQSIDGQGITPDIEIPTPEDLGDENDAQLNRAVEYLLTGE
ncbi:MAG TPA: S41 family peptidase [Candidatus Sulfomarinibacteraceae bacterium]|nr:S41 family peptidase [Candidatus Sulfomarinibacteraceae bacterium]